MGFFYVQDFTYLCDMTKEELEIERDNIEEELKQPDITPARWDRLKERLVVIGFQLTKL